MKPALILLLILLSNFAVALPADYKYYRSIDTKGIRETAWIALDNGILDNLESDGKDIRIFGNDSFLPFSIDYTKGESAIPIESIIPSSERSPYRGDIFSASQMIDGSLLTYYQNDT